MINPDRGLGKLVKGEREQRKKETKKGIESIKEGKYSVTGIIVYKNEKKKIIQSKEAIKKAQLKVEMGRKRTRKGNSQEISEVHPLISCYGFLCIEGLAA